MLFNSLTFVVFLPIVLLLISRQRVGVRNWILLAASYIFYGSWNWKFLFLLMGQTLVDHTAARIIHGSTNPRLRKSTLLVSIGINLTVLGLFKYFNFFIDSAAGLIERLGMQANLPTLQLILPVGISFYTLQAMSYVIDVYRGTTAPAARLRDFALYVAYFPHLVAGPIQRATDLLPQLESPGRVTTERINMGLMLMMVGFTKKVLIADSVANITGAIYSHPEGLSTGVLLKGAYLYTIQIYCDFSGYSDIARGVSELLGVRLTENFRQPYLSQSVTEFWRRWHISLASWLRDYLYIPLGGSRLGEVRTYWNVMLTWLICGLWHGAAWTYVLWGGLNGFYICVERLLGIGRVTPGTARTATQWLARIGATVITFHLIVITFIVFPAPSFGHLWTYLAGIVAWQGVSDIGWLPVVAAVALFAIDIPQNAADDHTVFLRLPWWVQSPTYAALLLAMVLYGEREIPFIYFQF